MMDLEPTDIRGGSEFLDPVLLTLDVSSEVRLADPNIRSWGVIDQLDQVQIKPGILDLLALRYTLNARSPVHPSSIADQNVDVADDMRSFRSG